MLGYNFNMNISIIAALDQNKLIGANQKLPWHLPADLKRFKQLTWGKPILMGRKTHESIGRLLPNRQNIVLTQSKNKHTHELCQYYPSFDDAFSQLKGVTELMVIGGQTIFEQALPLAKKIYLTHIHDTFSGDAYFPSWNKPEWIEVACEHYQDSLSYSFVTLKRI